MRRRLVSLLLMAIDCLIVSLIPLLALWLRFEGNIPVEYWHKYIAGLPYFVGIRLVIFWAFGLYRRLWQYASIHELLLITASVTTGSIVLVAVGAFTQQMLPRSTYLISWIFTIVAIGTSRLALRVYYYLRNRTTHKADITVLIIGAGDAGAVIAREIKNTLAGKKRLVGFIDDSDFKKKQMLFGVPVLGARGDIAQVVAEQSVNEIIIAMPSVSGAVIREIADECRDTGCRVQVVPGLYELIDGEVSLSQVRDLNLEDLLRRDPIRLETESIQAFIKNKRVLVTGAGGSIGSELCRQILRFSPTELVLLGKGENSIYEINLELKEKCGNTKLHTVIADVRDAQRMQEVFSAFRPQVVFHAAAHKHVPLMELQPVEAVRNNVLGTRTAAKAAIACGAEAFILISTDKAVNPTSVMGATKRVAELVIRSLNGQGTRLAAVRFGNVLGSRGSVVPLFRKQIARGGPITITDPDMKRYFMTIPEAAQLVLQAGAQAEGGEVFVLDMGEPVNILDMAKDLIHLSGLEPFTDIPIEFCGLRPGEKLFEELLTAEEGTRSTQHEKIFVANLKATEVERFEEKFAHLLQASDSQSAVEALGQIVETYHPNRIDAKCCDRKNDKLCEKTLVSE